MKWTRQVIGLLPEEIRYRLYRRLVQITSNLPPGITVKLAETQDEFEAVFRLIHDSYVEMEFCQPQSSGMRVSPIQLSPTCAVIVVKHGEIVVGTVSIFVEGILSLPLDFDFDCRSIARTGERRGEIIGLAIHPDYRGRDGVVLFSLFRFLYRMASHYMGIDCLQIATAPQRADLYRGLLCFSDVDSRTVLDQSVGGAEMCGLYLDLNRAPSKYAEIYRSAKPPQDLFTYFTGPHPDGFIYPSADWITCYRPRLSPDQIEYFGTERSNALRMLDQQMSIQLAASYLGNDYRKVFSPVVGTEVIRMRDRGSFRFPGVLRARAEGHEMLRVTNFSKTGLAIHGLGVKASVDEPLVIDLQLTANLKEQVLEKPVWVGRQSGALVIAAGDEWRRYLEIHTGVKMEVAKRMRKSRQPA